MKKERIIGLFGVTIYSLLILWLVAPVMRESDQASLIEGALLLARGEGVISSSYYNYSGQWGSYWLLSLLFKISGLDVEGSSPERIVYVSNFFSASSFLLGILFLAWKRGPDSDKELWIWGAVLFAPCVMFSAPLLSSNLISAGILCLLVVLWSSKSGRVVSVACGVFSFIAVAARADAVLVFPLLAFSGLKELSRKEIFGSSKIWAGVLGSSLALLIGFFLAGKTFNSYPSFFSPMVAGSYLCFGLGGALFSLALMIFNGLKRGSSQKSQKYDWLRAFVVISLLGPLFFYGRILFTPRHLFMTAMGLIFFLSFDSGKSIMISIGKMKYTRLVFLFIATVTFVPLLLGVRLKSMSAGRPVLNNPTLFPSADGFWPMGCYGQFLGWLKAANRLPIDHNQRVWGTWVQLGDVDFNKKKSVEVVSKTLKSFGELRLTILGNTRLEESKKRVGEASYSLIDERTFSKRSISVSGLTKNTDMFEAYKGQFSGKELELFGGESLFLLNDSFPPLQSEKILVLEWLKENGGGDDYLVRKMGYEWSQVRGGGPFQWFVFSRDEALGRDSIVLIKSVIGELADLSELLSEMPVLEEDNYWIARSSLPAFMKVKNYKK